MYFITYKYTWVPKSLRKIQQKSLSGRGAVSLASRMLLRRLSLKALCAVKVWLHFFLRELGWVMGWLLAAFRRGRGCICSSLQRNLPGWGAEGGAEVSRRSLERRAAQPCHPGGKRMRLMRGRSSPPTIRRGVALVCLGAEAGFRSRVGVGCWRASDVTEYSSAAGAQCAAARKYLRLRGGIRRGGRACLSLFAFDVETCRQ